MKAAPIALGLALLVTLGAVGWMRSQVVNARALYTFDVQDKRKLVGFASHVFVGRVGKEVGTEGLPTSKPGYSAPQTQFAVEVLDTIKGRLAGTVTVNQRGGYRDGVLVLMEHDPLLVPGQTYLFVTRLNPDKGWYTISAPGLADIPLTDAAQRAAVVAEFREAHRQEIPQP
jgi:hypothetical protein